LFFQAEDGIRVDLVTGVQTCALPISLLTSLLGGDRLASRSEIRKLTLYAHGQSRVEIDDVLAVVADASMLALDTLIDAAFAGRRSEERRVGKERRRWRLWYSGCIAG